MRAANDETRWNRIFQYLQQQGKFKNTSQRNLKDILKPLKNKVEQLKSLVQESPILEIERQIFIMLCLSYPSSSLFQPPPPTPHPYSNSQKGGIEAGKQSGPLSDMLKIVFSSAAILIFSPLPPLFQSTERKAVRWQKSVGISKDQTFANWVIYTLELCSKSLRWHDLPRCSPYRLRLAKQKKPQHFWS